MIHLVLPLPESPNALPSNHMARHRLKKEYMRKCWAEAIQQHAPPRDPPSVVSVSAVFFTGNVWDEDNLSAGLKFVLDTLKQKQRGKLDWRQGIADQCGYFVDDDPRHLKHTGIPKQAIDRKNPRLELILGWRETQGAA